MFKTFPLKKNYFSLHIVDVRSIIYLFLHWLLNFDLFSYGSGKLWTFLSRPFFSISGFQALGQREGFLHFLAAFHYFTFNFSSQYDFGNLFTCRLCQFCPFSKISKNIKARAKTKDPSFLAILENGEN